MLRIKFFQSGETEKDVNQFLKDTNGQLVKMWVMQVNEPQQAPRDDSTLPTFINKPPRMSIAVLYQTSELGGMKILKG